MGNGGGTPLFFKSDVRRDERSASRPEIIILAGYNGGTDGSIGTPIAGRRRGDVEVSVVGPFVPRNQNSCFVMVWRKQQLFVQQ
jgi:hypothetical protein